MIADDDLFNDFVLIEEVSSSRKPKNYKIRINPFEKYDENEFIENYRFDKETVKYIVDLVREDLEHISNRGLPLSPELVTLTAIRYLAKGSYQKDIGDLHNISQQSVSYCIKNFAIALASKMDQFIYFPSDQSEISKLKRDFYEIAGFPQCVAAIDGSHFKIKHPGGEFGARHRCRKGFYSINVQVLCNSKCKILDIVARWRGSAHDSRIWRESRIKTILENLDLKGGVVVGDGGYTCSRLMMTPFRLSAELSPEESRYNIAQIATRNTVERLFGQFKNKFRVCLNGIQVNYETAKAVIVAIAVLFNISKERECQFDLTNGNEEQDDSFDDESDENNTEERLMQNRRMPGRIYRTQFINKYFRTTN